MARTVDGKAATICAAGERLEEADAQHPDTLAGSDECVDGLLQGAVRRAHRDDHAVRVGGTVVVHQPVAPAGPGGELVHDLLDDPGTALWNGFDASRAWKNTSGF